MQKDADCIQAIVRIGFTDLEARVYTFLVRETEAATGYRIAQAVGKPAANVYKALESLEAKGAVLVDDAETRVFRAVPSGELLEGLRRQFKADHDRAATALSRMAPPSADDRLYQLRSRRQVMERCRAMLKRAVNVAIMDLFPPTVSELRDDLEATARRGVEVVIKAYEPIAIPGARVVIRPRGHEIVDAIPGTLLSINVDGTEHLLAMLGDHDDRVHQAIWTRSGIVAYLLYNGMINEVSQVAVMDALDSCESVAEIRERFHELRHLHPISSRGPVYRNLVQHMGISPPCTDAAKEAP